MKKSLIALAVLAASGASFAQVSVTGNLTYGYQGNTIGGVNGGPTIDNAGFGAETARVIFTAKEDLGGGYAATAVMQVNSGATAAGQAAGAEDTTLTLATPVGGLVLGTVKGADYLSGGIAGVGAYYAGWDGKVQSARTTRDMWAFVVPVGAFTFAIGQQEAATNALGTPGGLGLGVGTTGALAATDILSASALTNVSVSYAAGPLAANGQYLAYKNASGIANNKDTARISVSYDLGVVKLGAGGSVTNVTGPVNGANAKVTDYLVAAKVPMGASSFGVSYNSRTWDDINAAATARVGAGLAGGFTNGTGTGYSLEYGYAMSKRTSVIANYARWTQVGSGLTAGRDADTQYQLLLSHSF